MILGHFGFSYIGLLYLIMLFVPNIFWTKNLPENYTCENENRILLIFERTGEVLTVACALIFSDFNLRPISLSSLWLALSFTFMILYEIWWIRYFKSDKKLSDFYSSFWIIPVAGATLPVFAFFLLGIYGRVIWMIISSVILGIGHIGIHIQHKKDIL